MGVKIDLRTSPESSLRNNGGEEWLVQQPQQIATRQAPTTAMEEMLEVKIELSPGLVSFLLDRELKAYFRF